MRRAVAVVVLLAAFHAGAQQKKLTIVKAGPVGEVASITEANEVRVVFSEPMVVLGRITSGRPPWFHIAPAVKGEFRWSGTTTLIFAPDPKTLPFATRFDVTIDAGARSVAGSALDRTYTFSFTTPTIRLFRTDWYRKGNRFDGPVVIALRFNQPVDPQAVLPHLQLRTRGHAFTEPSIPPAGVERLKAREPQALQAFAARVAKAKQAAGSDGAIILSSLAEEWDRKRFRPSSDLLVLETKPGVPPDTQIQVWLGPELARSAERERTGRPQEYTVSLEQTLFVEEPECMAGCDPQSWNPIRLRVPARVDRIAQAVSVFDVTNPAAERKLTPKPAENRSDHPRHVFSLDELGYSIEPAHTYAVRIDPSLTAADGQQLGYTWMGVIEYWHERAFTSFGDGHGVWEAGGGPVLPFYSRNFRNVRQWAAPLEPHELMPTLLALANSDFTATPKTRPRDRNLSPIADEIQSFGLDIASVLGPDGKGLAWVAVQEGETIERARTYHDAPRTRATLVQVTNLGLTVKDSPQNTLVFVTRLDDGSPVAGANVSIRDVENKVVWSGTTDAKGIAVAPNTPLRLPKKEEKRESPPDEEMAEEQSWEDNWTALEQIHFVVIAEKEGDVAYSVSNWHDGITPWDFGANFDLGESAPLLRGSIFSDRGVYKLGEEVHLKAIVRSDTPDGMKLLPAGAKLEVVMRDSHDQEADRRTLTLNDWSSAEWTVRIPNDRPLGTWAVTGFVEGTRLSASGRFLVAAYRRPDFRVDVTLDGGDGTSSLAGNDLAGTIRARYLFGAPMSGREVEWTYAKRAVFDVPSPIRNRFPGERYVFLGWDETVNRSWTTLRSDAGELDAKGEQKLALDTDRAAGWPYEYRLEGEVTDVSRQKIAGRAVRRVDPAPWYIGVKAPPFFADAKSGVATEIVAAAVDGTAVAGVNVTVELKQIQWTSVRRAEGNGFYTWETERKEVPAGKWSVTTAAQPVPLQIDVPRGGYYEVIARASDAEGRSTRTRLSFYAVGDGYTAWERFDHNRIDLVPEKKRYRPGETARIMIKSPWEEATALLTVEREGVRSHQQFKLTSTQPTVSVPITGRDIPNVFVSVVLIKGRTKEAVAEDASDPGKPAFRVGYVELDVEDATKRLAVDVKANRDEYRPASKARIDVSVRDAQGRPSQSEVTLWAVDYGVLSLTAYQTPDILDDVYIRKALQVVTGDSREKIISRRVLTPKGASEGGGGGVDAGPGTLRKDFRVLAFWLGSVVTDRRGHARAGVTLPESLTTYRIMAVAGDRESRFGWGESEIRVNKPLLLLPAFPRFLSVGDKALFGAVVHSQLARGGGAAVTIRSLTPGVLEFSESRKEVTIAPKASAEVRFDAVAKAAGEAKVQVTVKMGGESDGFEETVPVRVLVSPESVAAYGEAKPQAQETVAIPKDAIPGFGGMTLQVASTAMAGLGEGARYLVDYPYGCAEQKSSSALALMLASHLGEAFALPGVDARKARGIAQATLDEMKTYQCGDGGFAFWPGDCAWASPYLTAYVLHVHQRGKNLGFAVDDAMLQRGYEFLERSLGQPRPDNEGWMPAYTAWQAFAVKVLTEGGRNADSHINRLYGYVDRMPLFGISHLFDALAAKKETGQRVDQLRRRMLNAVLPEGATAHVEELSDPYLLWFWNSNVRSTAIVLGSLVRSDGEEEIARRMVRWLMAVRKKGRWGNTQENAWAMGSLVDYYRRYEAEVPDFTAVVSFGSETLLREPFRGRSAEAKSRAFPMSELLARAPAGQQVPVTFQRDGAGTLFYAMRLQFATSALMKDPLDQGFRIERTYTLQSGTKAQKVFKAGDLIKVTLRVRNTKERRFVAVTDPIPAGTEPVEAWFATTAAALAGEQTRAGGDHDDWSSFFRRGGWDHVERHDDRVNVFATRLAEGTHEYTYLLRATTAGTFVTAPARAEEMYEPEVFGRTASEVVEVRP